jgi:hypothetical protein
VRPGKVESFRVSQIPYEDIRCIRMQPSSVSGQPI